MLKLTAKDYVINLAILIAIIFFSDWGIDKPGGLHTIVLFLAAFCVALNVQLSMTQRALRTQGF